MNLNFLNNLEKAITKTKEKNDKDIDMSGIDTTEINQEELELAKKLQAVEEYTIDRFEEDFVILEDKNGDLKEVEKEKIPKECSEGDILKCINGKYRVDKEETERVANEIHEKYKKLWE